MNLKTDIFTIKNNYLIIIVIYGFYAHNSWSADVNKSNKHTTTLSAAAAAANAAVNAANSAATAAAAAAAAATAAVQAMNAILPASERVSNEVPPDIKTLDLSPPKDVLIEAGKELNDTQATYQPITINDDWTPSAHAKQSKSKGVTPKFEIPSEKSLVGLIGQLEVIVGADARKEFMKGISGFTSGEAGQVQPITSLDLNQAVKASMGFSRDVLIAQARKDQAKAQTGQARSFMLPSLIFNHKVGNEISRPGSQIDAVTGREVTKSNHFRRDSIVTLKQPIFDIPGYYDYKRRQVIEESRAEGVRSSEGDAYLATVNAFLGLASTRLQANMAIDYENQLKELLIAFISICICINILCFKNLKPN